MRFIKAHIYGFGKWLDQPFTFNENGITCFFGDNESGKSTFQAFISFILFGLTPKEREFYRPKTSGTLGGELVVLLDSGENVTIRRVDGQNNCNAICLLDSSEEKDEGWLTTNLKGMTSDLFESTFQFTTEDLYQFEQIELDHIGEVLLNASISGASHMHKTEKLLERELDDLFKPRGSIPKINKQLNHLDKIQSELNEHAHITEEYRELTERITQNNREKSRLQQKLIEARKKRIIWEQVEIALPFIQQYEQGEKKLDNNKRITFNENGPEQFEEKKHLKKEYVSNEAIIQQDIDRYVKEMEDIRLTNFEVVETGTFILQEKEDWSYHLRVQNDLDRERENIQTEINTRMNPFANLLPDGLLNEMTIPPFIEKKWRDLAREAELIEDLRTEQAFSVRNEEHALMQLEEKIVKESIKTLPKEQYRKLNKTLDMDKQARSNAIYLEQVTEDKSKQTKKIGVESKKALKFLIGLNGLAIFFIVLAIFMKVTWFYHGAIISGALGWLQWYFKRKEYIADKETNMKSSPEKAVDLTEKEQEDLQEQLDAHLKARESILFLKRQKEESDQLCAKLQKELDELIKNEQQLNEKIEQEVLLYPFLDRIEIPYWEEVGHVLRDVQVLHTKSEDANNHFSENERLIDTFEKRVEEYVQKHFKKYINDPIPIALSMIEKMIQDDIKNRQRHEKVYFEKEEAIAKQKQIKDKLSNVEVEMKAILIASNAETEEELLKQQEKYLEQEQQLQQVEDAKQQLIRIFSSSTWDVYLHQEIESHTINYELLTYREQIVNYEKDIDEVRSDFATSTAELNQLEKSDSLSYSEQMHAFEVEKTLLQELATKWAVHQVAKSTLQKTKQSYMSKHLDTVLKQATEHFTKITDQRYIAIHADLLISKLSVIDSTNTHYTAKELSKGTRDQLYVAIRLAMSQHIQESTPYPFIFDDSFVHFDKNRTERMIQLIVDVAQKQQVIIFTCKEEIQEIIGTYAGDNSISMVRIQ